MVAIWQCGYPRASEEESEGQDVETHDEEPGDIKEVLRELSHTRYLDLILRAI
jgi:hypothetical protein